MGIDINMTYIIRELEKEIISFLDKEEIIAVMGSRQVGKTTMINHILENIKNKKIVKISFDDLNIKNLFVNNTEEFIERYVKNTDILFIDEIHYAKESGRILKYIYDKYKTKMIITGSSSIDLSINSLRYLVGRVINFELFSFSFYEFLYSKEINLAEMYKKGNLSKDMYNSMKFYFEEYLKYGGYPKVVLEKNINLKEKILKNILYTYALRDVKLLSNLSDDFKFNNLLKALSLQIGNVINYKELNDISGLNNIKLKNIINILNKTYICREIYPYFKNKRTELTKSKKIYFFDMGLRNAILNVFSVDGLDIGFIKENFIFSELIRKELEPKYWRTNHGAEVDFIFEKEHKLYPVEIKNKLVKPNITKSYLSFLKKYNPSEGFIFSDYLKITKKYGNTKVNFISFINIYNFINNMKK